MSVFHHPALSGVSTAAATAWAANILATVKPVVATPTAGGDDQSNAAAAAAAAEARAAVLTKANAALQAKLADPAYYPNPVLICVHPLTTPILQSSFPRTPEAIAERDRKLAESAELKKINTIEMVNPFSIKLHVPKKPKAVPATAAAPAAARSEPASGTAATAATPKAPEITERAFDFPRREQHVTHTVSAAGVERQAAITDVLLRHVELPRVLCALIASYTPDVTHTVLTVNASAFLRAPRLAMQRSVSGDPHYENDAFDEFDEKNSAATATAAATSAAAKITPTSSAEANPRTQLTIFGSSIESLLPTLLRGESLNVFLYGNDFGNKSWTCDGGGWHNYVPSGGPESRTKRWDCYPPRPLAPDFKLPSEQANANGTRAPPIPNEFGLIPRALVVIGGWLDERNKRRADASAGGGGSSGGIVPGLQRVLMTSFQIDKESICDCLPPHPSVLARRHYSTAGGVSFKELRDAHTRGYPHNYVQLHMPDLAGAVECDTPTDLFAAFALSRTMDARVPFMWNMSRQYVNSISVVALQIETAEPATASATATSTDSKSSNEWTYHVSNLRFVLLPDSRRQPKAAFETSYADRNVSIARALLALGNCVSGLTSPTKSFVPYRDSKLTRYLTNALGGNERTIWIGHVSGTGDEHDEDLSTLRYLERAQRVCSKIVAHAFPFSLAADAAPPPTVVTAATGPLVVPTRFRTFEDVREYVLASKPLVETRRAADVVAAYSKPAPPPEPAPAPVVTPAAAFAALPLKAMLPPTAVAATTAATSQSAAAASTAAAAAAATTATAAASSGDAMILTLTPAELDALL